MSQGRIRAIHGDSREVLKTLADGSVDSCVCDPPYALTSTCKRWSNVPRTESTMPKSPVHARVTAGFMGQKWDTGDTAFDPEFWAEVLRVLKPGAHLLAFGGTRTYHRLACSIEDGGFEIRDAIMWHYGSGFPKSHNAGNGWGTALKPATEIIAVARKPLIGTVAQNVVQHGTGAINVDGCRVETEGARPWREARRNEASDEARNAYGKGLAGSRAIDDTTQGRWPANVIHDGSEEVLECFPDAPGQIADVSVNGSPRKSQNVYGAMARGHEPSADRRYTDRGATDFAALPGARRGDSGSAARFFYCAKASRDDRDHGCEGIPLSRAGMLSETSGQHITRRDGGAPGPAHNNHPTVKPTDLMRWLTRLVTPPGGTVLDPFMGSGSTGRGCAFEGFGFIGIEREAPYFAIAEARIAAALLAAEAERFERTKQPSLFEAAVA